MNDLNAAASPLPADAPGTRPLSQVERVVDTFIAPTKTFTDILRDQSWWLPFLISIVLGYGFVYSVGKQVGWERVVENAMKVNPAQEERVSKAPPEQQATIRNGMVKGYQYTSYAFPIFVLVIAALAALVLMGTVNFGFGGKAKFGQVFAVFMYAGLPGIFKSILTMIVLFIGLNAESFQLQNPVGTNLGYYLSPESPKWLLSLATSIDVLTIWTLVLMVIGLAIVGRVKRGAAATAVVGWWFLITLAGVAYAAISG